MKKNNIKSISPTGWLSTDDIGKILMNDLSRQNMVQNQFIGLSDKEKLNQCIKIINHLTEKLDILWEIHIER